MQRKKVTLRAQMGGKKPFGWGGKRRGVLNLFIAGGKKSSNWGLGGSVFAFGGGKKKRTRSQEGQKKTSHWGIY